MTLDDQKHIISLWIQFLDGNENAFSQLYCLFLDDLLTYGRRVGGDNEMGRRPDSRFVFEALSEKDNS